VARRDALDGPLPLHLAGRVFDPWPDASGQWISGTVVEPVDLLPIKDLLACHVSASVELRITPDLWRLRDVAVSKMWDFSIVRMSNAAPRRRET
jgi:hypothetical protein